MALKLRPATLADLPTLIDIYYSAFSTDAIAMLVFPRGPTTTSFLTAGISQELEDSFSHFICVYSTANPDQIVAYAKWNSTLAPLPDPNDLPTWPANQELGDHFFGSLFRNHVEIMGGRKHWYLEILATRKEWQGKGAGGMLLRWGLEKADEEGVECFIEASPEGKPIYEKFGWRERARLVLDLKGRGVEEEEYVEVFMVREGKVIEGYAGGS